MDKQEQPKTLSIQIVQEVVKDKRGKPIKDSNGELQYKREDFTGLTALLNYFNSTLHTMDEIKSFIWIKDIILQYWVNSNTKIDLPLDEALFLRNYLNNLIEKDAQGKQLKEFEMRTMIGISEQLG